MNKCDNCGLEYIYPANLHKCNPHRDKGFTRGESWVDECMRKQRERRDKTSA